MDYATPPQSDAGSNCSCNMRDCRAMSMSTTGARSIYTACLTMDGDHTDYFPMPSTPEGQPHRKLHEAHSSIPAATLTPDSSPTCTATVMNTANEGSFKPGKARGRQYAVEDDWRRHREQITSLYKTKRLKDVMMIMQDEHNLFATERMYKARFKEWGLQKNVTATEVQKLMQKVEEEQQRHCQRSPPSRNGRLVLDIGKDVDVKRIQKYMKRRPKGLDKLRKDRHQPLEVIKALSVDGATGRGKVSISTVKLEEQERNYYNFLTSSEWDMTGPWSPRPSLPDDVPQLLQIFIDNGFDAPYPYTYSPGGAFTLSLPSQWQRHGPSHSLDSVTSSIEAVSSRDVMMLDFALKFRVAHILLDEGSVEQGQKVIDMCLGSLALCLQQAQHTSSMSKRPATAVVLWALSAALEMMVDFKYTKKVALDQLYDRLAALCEAYQPTMAEIVRLLSRMESREQVAMIKLARQMISRALSADASYFEPCFEMYSRTVDVAISLLPPPDKVGLLHTLADEPMLPGSPTLDAWKELRIALAVVELPPFLQQEYYQFPASTWSYDLAMPSSWKSRSDKIASVLKHVSSKVESHKSAGSWQIAQELATQAASMAELAWGSDDEMTRHFRVEAEALRSPGLIPSQMVVAMESSSSPMSCSLSDISFGGPVLDNLTWQQEQFPLQGQEFYAYPPLPQWSGQMEGGLGNSYYSSMYV
ncbi:hypothetical protein VM1G_02294 [Cytospora mali]|uniref:Clr5 domain-containing protein n=1 Tax=Cytospora mali TaxID=578113 RepID=A0A194VRH5_CYTMA|nr:hypothetical protein VM1G_02294 [Valsa mali]